MQKTMKTNKNKTKSEKNEYWHCIIGPTVRSKLPFGADGPMKMIIQDKFEKITGHSNEYCWSGWGLTEKQKDLILQISIML